MANPYSATFPHNKIFEISANPGVGYQVKLVDSSGVSLVTYQTGMSNTFDMRFCDEEDNELLYWVESTTGAIVTEDFSASVFVKLASATATQVIFNWGNESATDGSSESTMEFVDTFSGDLSKWAVTGENVSVTDGICSLVSTVHSSVQKIVSSSTFTPPWTYGVKLAMSGEQTIQIGCRPDLSASEGAIITLATTTDNLYSLTTINNNVTSVSTTSIDNNPHEIEIKTTSGNTKYIIDDVETAEHTTNNPSGAVPIRFAVSLGTYATVASIDIDYVYIRKYLATEPTFSEVFPVIADFSADITTGTNPLTVTFTDASTGTPTSWLWDFGDGNTSETQSPTHIYAGPGTYTVSLTTTNSSVSDTETKIDYISVTPASGSAIVYIKVYEMDHKVGTTQKHSFQIAGYDGSGFKSTCTDPVISCSVNGAAETHPTWTISTFNNTMGRFSLEVIDPGTWSAGDNIDINISCDEGEGYIALNVVLDPATLTVDTTGLVAAVGAEKIVPADKYTFDASAKTLTFSSPYDTLTVEQVTFIKNLTTNYIIWDCRYAGYQTLPIRFGAAPYTHVLSFDSADLDAADTDKIMIVVNQV